MSAGSAKRGPARCKPPRARSPTGHSLPRCSKPLAPRRLPQTPLLWVSPAPLCELRVTQPWLRAAAGHATWLAAYRNWLKSSVILPVRCGSKAVNVRTQLCRKRHILRGGSRGAGRRGGSAGAAAGLMQPSPGAEPRRCALPRPDAERRPFHAWQRVSAEQASLAGLRARYIHVGNVEQRKACAQPHRMYSSKLSVPAAGNAGGRARAGIPSFRGRADNSTTATVSELGAGCGARVSTPAAALLGSPGLSVQRGEPHRCCPGRDVTSWLRARAHPIESLRARGAALSDCQHTRAQ
jgi:hypothetical protein